ncbi:hypothetical protein DNTS_005597, partial [Danionella cerebrum]
IRACNGAPRCFGNPETESVSAADLNTNSVKTSSAEELLSEQSYAVVDDLGLSSSSSSAQSSSSLYSIASLSSLQLIDGSALVYEVKSCRYAIGKKLNERDRVSVFKGIRMEDGTKIALKVSCRANTVYSRIEGHSEAVPLEIKLLTLANQKPRIPQIAELLDWQADTDGYTMVLERPSLCKTLAGFLEQNGGSVSEQLASVIVRQIAFAASTCLLRGVFHGDINLQNIIINSDTFEIKLVGFGNGKVTRKSPFRSFNGTYSPPEFERTGEYHGDAATAWSVGMVMFAMLCGRIPEVQDLDELDRKVWSHNDFSKECCELLCSLLRRNPRKRLHVIKVCQHNWFKALYYEQDGPEIIEVNSCSYEVILKIGSGGFGSIYKAVRLSDGRRVALKFADRTDIEYMSTKAYIPPEFKENGKYFGKPATVWSLGILLFFLVTGDYPSSTDLMRLDENSWTYFDYSKECCKRLCSLLQRDPEKRCELEDISGHAWFNSCT